jgi:hypothetical protein
MRLLFIAIIIIRLPLLAFNQTPKEIFFSPDLARGMPQSKILDSLQFIVLKNPNNYSFDNWGYFIYTDEYIIYYLGETRQMFFFKNNGDFVTKKSLKKYNPQNFMYDKPKKQLIIKSTNKNYKLIEKDLRKIEEDPDNTANKKYFKNYALSLSNINAAPALMPYSKLDVLDRDVLADSMLAVTQNKTSKYYKDTTGYEISLYKNNEAIAKFLPYNRKTEMKYKYSFEGDNIIREGKNNFLISRPYDYTIYRANLDSIWPAYSFKVPMNYALPKKFLMSDFKNKAEYQNFKTNNGNLIYQIVMNNSLDSLLVFQVLQFNDYKFYIIKEHSEIYYSLQKITPDSSTWFLPILGNGMGELRHNRFYTSISSKDLLDIAKNHPDQKYPEPLATQVKTLKENDPPVVVTFTLKSF